VKHGTVVQTGIVIAGNEMRLLSVEQLAVAYLRLTPELHPTVFPTGVPAWFVG
jgi:hypothetical protein